MRRLREEEERKQMEEIESVMREKVGLIHYFVYQKDLLPTQH